MVIPSNAFIHGRITDLDIITAGWRYMQKTMSKEDRINFERMINMPGFSVEKFEEMYLLKRLNPFVKRPEIEVEDADHSECPCGSEKDKCGMIGMEDKLAQFLAKWDDFFEQYATQMPSEKPSTSASSHFPGSPNTEELEKKTETQPKEVITPKPKEVTLPPQPKEVIPPPKPKEVVPPPKPREVILPVKPKEVVPPPQPKGVVPPPKPKEAIPPPKPKEVTLPLKPKEVIIPPKPKEFVPPPKPKEVTLPPKSKEVITFPKPIIPQQIPPLNLRNDKTPKTSYATITQKDTSEQKKTRAVEKPLHVVDETSKHLRIGGQKGLTLLDFVTPPKILKSPRTEKKNLNVLNYITDKTVGQIENKNEGIIVPKAAPSLPSPLRDNSPIHADVGRSPGTPDSGMISDISENKNRVLQETPPSEKQPIDPEKMTGRDGRRYRKNKREAELLLAEQLKLNEQKEGSSEGGNSKKRTTSESSAMKAAEKTGKEKRRLKDKLRKEKRMQEKGPSNSEKQVDGPKNSKQPAGDSTTGMSSAESTSVDRTVNNQNADKGSNESDPSQPVKTCKKTTVVVKTVDEDAKTDASGQQSDLQDAVANVAVAQGAITHVVQVAGTPENDSREAVSKVVVAPTAVAPSAVAPNAVASGIVAPDAVAPDAVAPDAVAPTAVAPTAVAPTAGAPDAVAPTAVAPSAVAPSAVAPDAVAPDAVAPDAVAQSTVAPDAVAPDAVAPDAVAPTAVAADAVAKSAVAPDAVAPDAVAKSAVAADAVAQSTVAPDAVAKSAVAADAVAQSTVAPDAVAVDAVAPSAVALEAVAPSVVAPDTVASGVVAADAAQELVPKLSKSQKKRAKKKANKGVYVVNGKLNGSHTVELQPNEYTIVKVDQENEAESSKTGDEAAACEINLDEIIEQRKKEDTAPRKKPKNYYVAGNLSKNILDNGKWLAYVIDDKDGVPKIGEVSNEEVAETIKLLNAGQKRWEEKNAQRALEGNYDFDSTASYSGSQESSKPADGEPSTSAASAPTPSSSPVTSPGRPPSPATLPELDADIVRKTFAELEAEGCEDFPYDDLFDETVVGSVIEPLAETVVEPVVERVVERVVVPVAEPVVEPAAVPVAEPPMKEDVVEEQEEADDEVVDEEEDDNADCFIDLNLFLNNYKEDYRTLPFYTPFARNTAPLFYNNEEFAEFCTNYSTSKYCPKVISLLTRKYIDTRIVFHYERFKKLADRESRRISKEWTHINESSAYSLMVMLFINSPVSNVGFDEIETVLFPRP